MKRVLTVLSLLLVPVFVSAENKIKMVTYFPVPYVAYSKINAQKQLDVGLTSACEMNLGCAESGALGTKPLQATTVNLNRGRLDLNNASAVKSTNVTLGSGSGEANIDFSSNLRIGTLNNGYSLEANDMTVDELKLFASHMRAGGEKFPSCAATGASGAPQISWQKLKLKNAEEVYLMCGGMQEAAPAPSCPVNGAGDPRTWWDEERQACGCPGSDEYYHAGQCCSQSTPKTNASCWQVRAADKQTTTVMKDTAYFEADMDSEGCYGVRANGSKVRFTGKSCSSLSHLPLERMCALTRVQPCVKSCYARTRLVPDGMYHKTVGDVYIAKLACQVTGYEPLWNPQTESRY